MALQRFRYFTTSLRSNSFESRPMGVPRPTYIFVSLPIGKARNLHPRKGARNTLKDFFSKATKGIFSVAYIKYYVASLLRTKT